MRRRGYDRYFYIGDDPRIGWPRPFSQRLVQGTPHTHRRETYCVSKRRCGANGSSVQLDCSGRWLAPAPQYNPAAVPGGVPHLIFSSNGEETIRIAAYIGKRPLK